MIKIYEYGKDSIGEILLQSTLDFEEVKGSVQKILKNIKTRGNEALFEYTKQFDKIDLDENNIKVSQEEIQKAYEEISEEQLVAIKNAVKNVFEYHSEHKTISNIKKDGGKETGVIIRPLAVAGIYVPGGTAAYPSSVLMCALPAKAAGVKKIVMCSPKITNPLTLVAANECGVCEIYRVGGAQAIGAMAYGNTIIPKVDIIAGPGNVFVTMAKKEVFGEVKIDMIAGPSEILVIADKGALPQVVAADLLSQAEHDVLSRSILITDSKELAIATKEEIIKQVKLLERREVAEQSLKAGGAIIIVPDLRVGVDISNQIAPEHLELSVSNYDELVGLVQNAGAIFAGYHTSESLGDYYAGPSHVLPTSGTAKYFEVLNTDTFTKKISYIHYDEQNLKDSAKDIIVLAESEGFTAHANAIKKRIGENN